MKTGSEAAFQQQVEQLAGFYGWLTYHTHDSRRSTPGFPDLVLVRGPELIFAELKTEKGRVRPEQSRWLTALHAVPAADTYIWRPSDFDDIHERLSRDRHRTEPIYRDGAAA